MTVVIVGAGVIGLTTALRLKQDSPDMDVTVVATHLPGDYHHTYTSPYAGANWMSQAGPADTFQQELDRVTYHELARLCEDPRSGVWRKKNASYYTQAAVDRKNGDLSKFVPWYEHMTNGKAVDKSQLVPGTVFGWEFDGFVVSVPTYLPYLVQRNLELGVAIKRVPKITHIEDARFLHSSGKKASVVVNCSGLYGTRIEGVSDSRRNFAVKGQVLVVRNTIEKIQIVAGVDRPNEELYVFPRKEGGAIIGGCFYKDNWDPSEDKELTQRIIARATKYLPDLVNPEKFNNPDHIDIVSVNVGLRPLREGGPRIERDPTRRWLVHGYGAGGAGYQSSYGFAKSLVKLVNEVITQEKL